MGPSTWALDQKTVEMIHKLKEAGLSDEAIVEILKLEKEGPQGAVGVMEVPRSDGKRDIIYYSVSTPEEKKALLRQRDFEYQKSWELPEHIILDQRR